jgi:CRISPR-associated endonuclease/helicase Cas3
MIAPRLTGFQPKVQEILKQGKSVLLVAPTGLGKTLAVTADLQERFTKTVYAVPLRALGVGIRDAISELRRDGRSIETRIHHGDTQESLLFSEEVVVTTYDQVVCGVPGLPLSLPLRAGHAVAAALLMSRLILDEVHLAWGISAQALSILLAVIAFRRKLELQTVVQTATLPDEVAKFLCKELDLELVLLGEGNFEADEGLSLRERNRRVEVSALSVKAKGETLDYAALDDSLAGIPGKRIYFANSVDRLQATYDRLVQRGLSPEAITVLHNRMPRSWRQEAEQRAIRRFGKKASEGDWLLLTNQVAEAGLDISAPLVISDPAPVDTLVQRAGRCARWFRDRPVAGEFRVLTAPNDIARKVLAGRYVRTEFVQAAIASLPATLTWQSERKWVNEAWGSEPKKALEAVKRALVESAFALNLFDRAAQEHRPGEIATVFREILSVEVAVEDANSHRDLQ